MSLDISPLDTLYNRDVNISAANLVPYDLYEIKLHYYHNMGTFRSYGVFKASGGRRIDVAWSSPIRGTYSGVRSMGLFESLEPLSDFRSGGYLRFYDDELKILNYEAFLYDCRGKLLDSKKFCKRLMGAAVERKEIKDNSLRGVLFKPEGDGPFPTIMDVLGTGGGLSEHRAAALASEGFCVFVIAYFQYKDLPKSLYDVNLEYLIENWLTSLSFTPSKIGLHGSSFGGILVLVLAKLCPQVHAVVSINPPHVMNSYAHVKYQGEPIGNALADNTTMEFRGAILYYDKTIRTLPLTEECDLHLEEIPDHVDIRFVVSIDDVSTSSLYSALYLKEKLQKSRHTVYLDARPGGHVMEPPYYPYHAFCYSRLAGGYMAYGGETSIHGKSQVSVWNETIRFFKDKLATKQETPISSKL